MATRPCEVKPKGSEPSGLVDEAEHDVASGRLPANVGGLDVQPVVAVREGAGVESTRQPDAVEPRLVRLVLACAGGIDAAEVDVGGRLAGDFRHERRAEVGGNPP